MTDVKTKIIAFGHSFVMRDQRDSLWHCCAVRQRLRHLPRIGSGGCRSTKANRLCFLVSTAAAATVTALMLLHRPSSDSLLCCTRALTEGVGLQVIVSIEKCISHTDNDSITCISMRFSASPARPCSRLNQRARNAARDGRRAYSGEHQAHHRHPSDAPQEAFVNATRRSQESEFHACSI